MKNSKKIAVILVLMLVAVGAYFVSGTYAKYTSTVTGTGTGTVAKWEWTVGGNSIDLTTAKTFTFNLFDTINEADTTTAEDNVAADVIGKTYICPSLFSSIFFYRYPTLCKLVKSLPTLQHTQHEE